ncbi:MAG: PIN domain-containing protein [Conexivisphaera sp.]
MEAVVDTNFVIAVIFKDHEHHEEALKEWGRINRAYLPLISLTEIAYFLIKNDVNLGIMDEVLSDPKIEVTANTADDLRFAVENRDRIAGYDDFNDFLILSVARRLRLPLLTFDRKLRRKSD